MPDILNQYKQRFDNTKQEELTLQEYLNVCKSDKFAYANPAERLLHAIGEPQLVDSNNDPKYRRFAGKVLKIYKPFADFHGMEETIEQIVAFLKHASQGLEERKQILYLMGPVGGGKSSLAEKLKELMEQIPFYALSGSPVHESPLCLFNVNEDSHILEEEYGIPKRYLQTIMSPWAMKRLQEFNGDIDKFKVIKLTPSVLKQIAIAKTEPGDENNQDVSSLVGKVDIRKLEKFAQDDPDAYSYSGGLCLANRGLLEFVEMFKAPIKVLHPLLTATQEGNYNGTESIASIPFDGIILAHSNESEWLSFKNNRNNEAFLDRINVIKVPYCLCVNEEVKIYQKLLYNSSLYDAPCAPGTYEMLAQFCILSRLKEQENSNLFSKLRVYNGENLKDTDPKAKSYHEYRESAGVDEGMTGLSTRFAYKILSKVFNYDHYEIAADPIHLMHVLEEQIIREQFPKEVEEKYLGYIKTILLPKYVEFVGKEIQSAYFASYGEYGQNLFERYITYADYWVQGLQYLNPETGELLGREELNQELEEIEKPAGINNPKDFRHEIVNFILRARAENDGKMPDWRCYERLRNVIEQKLFANTDEILPIISTENKSTLSDKQKHEEFHKRMLSKGYTAKQVRILCDWYLRVRKST